jgi:hypothetical protein
VALDRPADAAFEALLDGALADYGRPVGPHFTARTMARVAAVPREPAAAPWYADLLAPAIGVALVTAVLLFVLRVLEQAIDPLWLPRLRVELQSAWLSVAAALPAAVPETDAPRLLVVAALAAALGALVLLIDVPRLAPSEGPRG